MFDFRRVRSFHLALNATGAVGGVHGRLGTSRRFARYDGRMGYVATFDAGTTAMKGALVSDDGRIVASSSVLLDLLVDGDRREQDPDQWWRAFCKASRTMLAQAREALPHFNDADIVGVIFSGQMQDLIALDGDLRPVRNAILYSDGRADAQARKIASRLPGGVDRFLEIVGNRLEGCLPLPKLMWLREQEPETFARIRHVLISSKDYLIARLAGVCVGDVAACSTAGAMNIRTGRWDAEICGCAGIDSALADDAADDVDYADGACNPVKPVNPAYAADDVADADDACDAEAPEASEAAEASDVAEAPDDVGGKSALDAGILPRLYTPQSVVGSVTAEGSAQSGLPEGTRVFAGFGDAGATTFASGVAAPGQYNINLGTSGWIATVSRHPFTDKPGAANLAFGVSPDFVNAVPFLNAGDVHKWAVSTFADGDYDKAHALLESSVPGAHGVLCLPYLVGERFPVMNAAIRGAFVGIGPDSTRADMLRAALEGVAFSIRQGMGSFDDAPSSITLIGGGARETVWCQMLADVLGSSVEVFENADILPAVSLASLVLRDDRLPERCRRSRMYMPDARNAAVYDEAYRRFLGLYPALSTLD